MQNKSRFNTGIFRPAVHHKTLVYSILFAAVLVGEGNAENLNNATAWGNTQDIPTPSSANPGLAGEQPNDITRYLLARGPSSVKVSPDGTTIAYLGRDTGKPQLYTFTDKQPSPAQITYGRSVQSFHWTPTGEHLLYAADRDGNERESFTLITPSGTTERSLRQSDDAFVNFGGFSADGTALAFASTKRNGTDFDIYTQTIADSRTRRVYEGKFGFYSAGWQPGEQRLLLTETRGEDGNNLYLLDIPSGNAEVLFKPNVNSAYDNIRWSLDGSGFYMTSDHDRELAALAYYDIKRHKLSWLAEPSHPISNVTLFNDDKFIAWTTNVDGFDRLQVMNAQTGKKLKAPELPNGVFALSGARKASTLAIGISGPSTPGEIWTWQPGQTPVNRVAATMAGLDKNHLVTPDPIRFSARDGTTLYGLMYRPTREAELTPPPTMIRVHGGPTGQARPRFDPVIQYLVQRGYAVLDLNFRGSTGYGKTFARLDNGRLRPNAVLDIADAVKWLRDSNSGDVSRLGIMGGSYGGYLTNAAVGAFPDTFKAAVSFVGVSDWVRALEDASPALKASDRIEYGDINNPADRKFFAEISPINRASQVKTPMVIVHGANDPRDPVAESDRFVSAVRQQEVEVKYLRFADEGHGLRKLGNRITAYQTIATFLDEKLGPSK